MLIDTKNRLEKRRESRRRGIRFPVLPKRTRNQPHGKGDEGLLVRMEKKKMKH